MKRALLPIIIALLLLLSACGETQEQPDDTDIADELLSSESDDKELSPDGDGRFTIRYESSYSFNPITGTSVLNMEVASLLYEGLFAVDSAFEAQPVLCESYSTEDGISWTFKIKENVYMSDGELLTADDVVYSINQATLHQKYASRLSCIDACAAEDEYTVYVSLDAANYSLPTILDIPVIRYGSLFEDVPAGSGPYRYSATPRPCLIALRNYREELPLSVIYLEEMAESHLPEAFSAHEIDVITCDPITSSLYLRNDHEIRYCDTSILEYIGFNYSSPALADSNVRKAISLCIDRSAIYNDIMGGLVTPAPTLIHSSCSYYDSSAESEIAYSMLDAAKLLQGVGMLDPDNDGWLEYPATNIQYVDADINFIVCKDSNYKVDTAKQITTSLRNMGLNVTLTQLSWNAYVDALESGNFDMYYAAASIPANFDFTELLSPGGSLNFGNLVSDNYNMLLSQFLAASSPEDKLLASGNFCAYAANDAAIIPLFYRMEVIHTNRSVVTGIVPTETTPFYNITGWTVAPENQ